MIIATAVFFTLAGLCMIGALTTITLMHFKISKQAYDRLHKATEVLFLCVMWFIVFAVIFLFINRGVAG